MSRRDDHAMDRTEGAEVKVRLNEQFARLAKAVGHPKRVEMLDLLAQGERPVESLAEATGLAVTTTSSHLAVLRNAHLVRTRKEGTHVFYRQATDDVTSFLGALRDLARVILPEVNLVERTFFDDLSEPMSRSELVRLAKSGEVTILDVRPTREYRAGHIRGAVSIPLDELEHRLDELAPDVEVIAYCRGPFCVLAPQAVSLLRHRGRHARRLADGLPEWRRAGLKIETGPSKQEKVKR
ncbi:MAG: ArsR/SmtB family transcription factor [Acidimicrobiales bacterium]